MRPRFQSPLGLIFFFYFLVPVCAQSSTSLHGRVLDSSEAGIAGAAITVVDQNMGFRRNAQSQPDGSYSVEGLRPGIYKITARKEGFRTMIRFNVRLGASQPGQADFVLSVGAVQETITVEGTAPLVNTEDTSVEAVISRENIENLPLNGRGLLALLEMTPGVSVTPATHGEAGQFTANGQRPNTHSFTVDGISSNTGVLAGGLPAQATGGSLPAMSAFGSLDGIAPLETVEEARIQTSSTGADYGRLPGASVSLNSRAGSNEFHGSGQYRFRTPQMAANDWFANQSGLPRPSQQVQTGAASLGGPIWHDHTFFFASWEGTRLADPYVFRMGVPSGDIRQAAPPYFQAAVNLFPAPNGAPLINGLAAWNGEETLPGRLTSRSLRLDQAITPRLSFFGRYSDTPSSNEFGAGTVDHLDFRSRALTLGLNFRPAASLTFDARANASETRASSVWTPEDPSVGLCALDLLVAHFVQGAAPCSELVRFTIGGAGQVVLGSEGTRRQRQLEVADGLTWTHGANELRAGTEYLEMVPARHDALGSLSILADTAADLVSSGNFWRASGSQQIGAISVTEFSAWILDSWRLTRRLTLNAGLRWEFDPPPTPRTATFFDPATGTLSSNARPLYPRSFRNFAPRVGAAYRFGTNTVLRGGAGLYYDSSLSIATDVLNGGPLSLSQFGSGRYGFVQASLQFGFLPDLTIPKVAQWNVSLEHGFTSRDALTVSYVGAAGRNLVRRELGGQGSTNLSLLGLVTNRGESDYHALQAQYERRFTHGLQARASYAWSHSIDNGSSDSLLFWTGGTNAAADRGSSDFDLRHSFTTALTYDLPHGWGRYASGWAMDGIVHARSGFPITIQSSDEFLGLSLANAFRPDAGYGVPQWVNDAAAPGGRRLNPAAFTPAAAGVQGSLGRNVITGFGMWQADLALRREFHLGDRVALQLRVEAFNVFNHPNFADPARFLNSPYFGTSTSMLNLMLGSGSAGSGLAPLLQSGGPRSIQAGLKLRF